MRTEEKKMAEPVIQTEKKSIIKDLTALIKGFSIKEWFENQKKEFIELIQKVKDLKNTNIALGLMHYNAGRTKDAIFRFKFINYFFPDVKIGNYYIGRSYIENLEFAKATKYLEKYLESGDQEKREEAKYCYDLTLERYENIKKIPSSLIKRIFNNIADKYDEIYLWDGCPQEKLLTQIRSFRAQGYPSNSILDVGCGNGSIAFELKSDTQSASIYGIEIANKLAERAKALHTSSGAKVLTDIMLADLENPELIKEVSKRKYDVIIFSLVLDYICDVEQVLSAYSSLLNEGGLLAMTYHTGSQKTIHALFDREYEEFFHSDSQMNQAISKSGLIELSSEDADFLGRKSGKVRLFTNKLRANEVKAQTTEAESTNMEEKHEDQTV